MQHVQMVYGRQRRTTGMRLNAEHVKVVATFIGRRQKHAGKVKGQCDNRLGMGDKMRDYRIGSVGGNRCTGRRTVLFDGVLFKDNS